MTIRYPLTDLQSGSPGHSHFTRTLCVFGGPKRDGGWGRGGTAGLWQEEGYFFEGLLEVLKGLSPFKHQEPRNDWQVRSENWEVGIFYPWGGVFFFLFSFSMKEQPHSHVGMGVSGSWYINTFISSIFLCCSKKRCWWCHMLVLSHK